jgi:hypothetical protein
MSHSLRLALAEALWLPVLVSYILILISIVLRWLAEGGSLRLLSIRDAAFATLILDVVPLAENITPLFFGKDGFKQLAFTAVLLLLHFIVFLRATHWEVSYDDSFGRRLLVRYLSFALLFTNAVSVERIFSLLIFDSKIGGGGEASW